ncbi:hypothetical protein GCM10020000_79670 [Streptomyces olivoverticillatus]
MSSVLRQGRQFDKPPAIATASEPHEKPKAGSAACIGNTNSTGARFGGHNDIVTTRQIRRKCQTLVDTLNLPSPFSIGTLIHEISSTRGRPIRVNTLPTELSGAACGLWIATDASDEIYVEKYTTQFHQEHIILHEIGHMLWDHDITSQESKSTLTDLLPSISPSLINRLLARSNYTAEQEQEAELVASLIHAAAETSTPSPLSGVCGELEAALGIRGWKR